MNCIYQVYTSPAFCTPSALRNLFLDAHRMQSDACILKKLTRCSALTSSRIAKQNSQIAPLRLRRVAFLFVLFACQMCAHFCMRACKMSARLTGLFQKNVWQPPALPCRLQHSTIGRTDLHRRVRDGNGCCLRTHRHQTNLSM